MKGKAKLRYLWVILLASLTIAGCTSLHSSSEGGTPPQPTAPAEVVDAVLPEVEAPAAEEVGADQARSSAPSEAANSEDLEASLISLYEMANPSVVYIIVPSRGSGSGFVYDSQGHIVTNNHVVSGARSVEVVFSNVERRTAQVIGGDRDSDLAVLLVDQLPAGTVPLSLATPEDLRVGQFVVAIGNPFGEQGSMSLGIISGLGRSLTAQRDQATGSTYSLPAVIQTDAAVNPGNSGGPLLNLSGEVVGITSAIATNTGTNSGVGFAIPVTAVRQVVPSLITDGEYAYPFMGAAFDEEVSLAEQSALGLPQTQGAYVVSISPGGPAAQAGLVAADPNTGRGGDLVVAIDGEPVSDFRDLNAYLIFHTAVGQTIQLTVIRDGEPLILPLTLGERP